MDRLYSSLGTAGYLVELEITLVRTWIRYRAGNPKEVKGVAHCHKKSTEMCWENDGSKPEAYSEPCLTSKMKHFPNIVYG